MIFGAKEVEVTRPDFANVINSTVHFSNGVSLSYEIPGNLSNLMGFAGGYVAGSPRTFQVSVDEQENFSQRRWRMAKDTEGSMVKANSERDLNEQTAMMLDDTETFMQRVTISQP